MPQLPGVAVGGLGLLEAWLLSLLKLKLLLTRTAGMARTREASRDIGYEPNCNSSCLTTGRNPYPLETKKDFSKKKAACWACDQQANCPRAERERALMKQESSRSGLRATLHCRSSLQLDSNRRSSGRMCPLLPPIRSGAVAACLPARWPGQTRPTWHAASLFVLSCPSPPSRCCPFGERASERGHREAVVR
ncbi:hypothetical protein IWZ00DRAFT_380223 [Phyllosticta capitalensis]